MTKEKTSALYSRYRIDGVRQELTPAQILDAVSVARVPGLPTQEDIPAIVDETAEVGLNPFSFEKRRINDYLELLLSTERRFPLAFSDCFTRSRIACALIDALWREGRFKLGDLNVKLSWKWNDGPVGNMAAFYASVMAAADYVDSLGLKIADYSIVGSRECAFGVSVVTRKVSSDEESLEIPYLTPKPRMGRVDAVPSSFVDDPKSWIVYVPFETAEYRFGGSLLSQALGRNGGSSLNIEDPDYFMDCFEVFREFVEDGILLSASTVGDGGLLTAVKRMSSDGVGAQIDVSDVLKSSGQEDVVRVLFAEVPGVIIQIRDIDFDYVDAELLLQDVAFFPLGHPVRGRNDIRIRASEKSGIQKILESLIQNQCGEGED